MIGIVIVLIVLIVTLALAVLIVHANNEHRLVILQLTTK